MFKQQRVCYAPENEGLGGAAGGGALVGGTTATSGLQGGAAGGGAGAGGPGAPWYTSAVRADLHPALAAKGWDKIGQAEFPNTVLEAYTGLEKLVGRARLAVPKDASDTEAHNALYNALGRPGKASEYKLAGIDEAYMKAIPPETKQRYLDAMHAAGIGEAQAEALFKANQAEWDTGREAKQAAALAANKAQSDALALEWGMGLEGNKRIAGTAVKALGLDEPTLTKMEDALGYDGLYKLLHNFGSKFQEDRLLGTGQASEFGSSPEAAKSEITKLAGDKEFQAKLQHRDPRVRAPALEKWEELHKRLG